jgi:MurNAc alpha-1-phosphate uridylyltransferase
MLISETAFILAAGFGTRLRPHTDHIPKPMVSVGGKPMIDHALGKLSAAGIKRCIINTHYKADILHNHLKSRKNPDVMFSHEPEILDTGGGLKRALHHFKKRPYLAISGDSVWEDSPTEQSLQTIINAWDGDKMDILILLQPVQTMTYTKGVGDYSFNTGSAGKITRSLTQTGTHMFTSIRIHHPKIFQNAPDTAFSYLELLDRAEQNGRLYGVEHKAIWHHISTPDDLKNVRETYTAKGSG